MLAMHPIDGAWTQLSDGYSNVLLPPPVEDGRIFENWASLYTEETTKS